MDYMETTIKKDIPPQHLSGWLDWHYNKMKKSIAVTGVRHPEFDVVIVGKNVKFKIRWK